MALGDIIQEVYGAPGDTGGGIIGYTLGSAPTVGNTLLFGGQQRLPAGTNPQVPTGFTDSSVGLLSPHEAAGRVGYRHVQPGDTNKIVWPGGGSWPDNGWVVELEGVLTIEVAGSLIDLDPGHVAGTDFGGTILTPTSGKGGRIFGYIFMKRSAAVMTAGSGWTLEDANIQGAVVQQAVVSLSVGSTSGSYTPQFNSATAQIVFDDHDFGAFTIAAIADIVTPPPGPPEVIITDPDLVALETLERVKKWSIRVELADTGAGDLVIDRHDPDVTEAVLKQGNWCRVVIPQIWDQPIFIWQLEDAEIVLLDEAEEGGETARWGGRGGLSIVERIKAWNESFVVPAGKDTDGIELGPASTGGKAGQILHRWVHESTHANRGLTDFPARLDTLDLMQHDFDYDVDSDGNAWVVTPSTADLGNGTVGENGLYSVAKLIATGALDVQMQPDMLLQAFNHYGTDRTSATFAAGKVRFVKGVNIARKAARRFGPALAPTHVLVQGQLPAYGYARAADFASRITVEGFVQTQGSDPDFLEEVGLSYIARALRRGESVQFDVKVPKPGEEDELAGIYLPGPPGSNGHYWVGDDVTLHTGTDYGDLDEIDVRIMAIVLRGDDANNLKATVEVKWTYLAGRDVRVVGGGGVAPNTTGGGVVPAPVPPAGTTHAHAHADLSGVTANQHHNQDHQARHHDAGADELSVLDLGGYPGGTANFLRADGTFAAPPSGGSVALADLTDVDLTGLADGDHIVYDSASGLWLPEAITGGGGLTHSFVGYNTIGANWETAAVNEWAIAKQIVLASDCVISEVEAYLQASAGYIASIVPALYTDDAGTPDLPFRTHPSANSNGNIVGVPATTPRWMGTGGLGWVPAGTYWIVIRLADLGGTVLPQIAYDSGADETQDFGAGRFEIWGGSAGSRKYSIRVGILT